VDNQFDKFSTINHHAFPLAKGKLLVRMENIADNFDVINQFEKNGFGEIFYINMNTFARDLYLESNPDTEVAKVPSFTVKELSMSGAYVQTELDKYKSENKWKGADDSDSTLPVDPKIQRLRSAEDRADSIALEPQRIRTFEIQYNMGNAPQAPVAAPVVTQTQAIQKPQKMNQLASTDLSQAEEENVVDAFYSPEV
jgi:hypothetical protein